MSNVMGHPKVPPMPNLPGDPAAVPVQNMRAVADLVDALAHLVSSRSLIPSGDHQELDKLIAELSDSIRGMVLPRQMVEA